MFSLKCYNIQYVYNVYDVERVLYNIITVMGKCQVKINVTTLTWIKYLSNPL